MPTYEYECTKCGSRFERFQGIKAEPLKRCPKCRYKVKRLLGSGAGIIFKGSGFYQTDYRSVGYKEAEKRESKAPSVEKKDKKSVSPVESSKK